MVALVFHLPITLVSLAAGELDEVDNTHCIPKPHVLPAVFGTSIIALTVPRQVCSVERPSQFVSSQFYAAVFALIAGRGKAEVTAHMIKSGHREPAEAPVKSREE